MRGVVAGGVVAASPAASSVVATVSGTKVAFRRLAARGSMRGVTFSLSVLAGQGTLRLADRVRHMKLRSTRIANVVVNDRRQLVNVAGLGRANGKLVRFTLTLADRLAHDLLALRLSNGYRLHARLAAGGISL